MEKHLKTLEQNVQWIALALGGIYLLYMVYAYVITPPVTVKLGAGPTAPALTPGEVDDAIAKKYAEPLKIAMSRSDTLDIKVTDVMGPYLARIDEKDLKTPDLATAWGGVRGEVPGVVINENNKNALIAQAPVLPKPVAVAFSSNIASVILPDAQPQNNNAVVPAGQALPPHKDTGWWSGTFKVPFADLQKGWSPFANANVPMLTNTKFLQVTLKRQEMLPNGQWGNETTIKPVGLASPVQFPGDDVPAGNAALRRQAAEYRQWTGSTEAQQEITQPAFPDVIPGVRVWYAPGQEPPDPTKKQRNGRVGAPVRPHLPPAPVHAPVQPAAPNPNGFNPQGGGQAAQGDFNVMTLNQDLDLMVHDTTAEPGHTYRYQVKYALSNPTWDSANLAVQKVADIFALESPPSDWTQPVTIPSTTQIFVVNVSSQTQSVRFDVFEWKDGKMTRSTVNAAPGDAIKDETVVDIRQDSGKRDTSYVLLVGPNGNLTRQDKQGDAANPDYDKLKAEVAVQQEQDQMPNRRQQALAR